MKVRRLQRKDDEGQWYDDAYAVEDGSGRATFHFSIYSSNFFHFGQENIQP
jgi:hypothetical protein